MAKGTRRSDGKCYTKMQVLRDPKHKNLQLDLILLSHPLGWKQDGFGVHLADVDKPADEVIHDAKLDLFILEIFYACSLSFSKFALIALYWRIFNSVQSAKIMILILAVVAGVWMAARVSDYLSTYTCPSVFFGFKSLMMRHVQNKVVISIQIQQFSLVDGNHADVMF